MKFVKTLLVVVLAAQFSAPMAHAQCSTQARLPEGKFEYDRNIWNAMILPTIAAAVAIGNHVDRKTDGTVAPIAASVGVMLSPIAFQEGMSFRRKGQRKSAAFVQSVLAESAIGTGAELETYHEKIAREFPDVTRTELSLILRRADESEILCPAMKMPSESQLTEYVVGKIRSGDFEKSRPQGEPYISSLGGKPLDPHGVIGAAALKAIAAMGAK